MAVLEGTGVAKGSEDTRVAKDAIHDWTHQNNPNNKELHHA